MRISAVGFDMDGTLLNSGTFGVTAIQRAFADLIADGRLHGVTEPASSDAIRAQIGKPPWEFYCSLLPVALHERAGELHHRATVHENEMLRSGDGHLFDGVTDVLAALKEEGRKLLLVSNCSQAYMDTVVEVHGLDTWLDYRACVGDTPGKTKSGLLAKGLAEVEALTGAVFIGDRSSDSDAARDCGIEFLGRVVGIRRGRQRVPARRACSNGHPRCTSGTY